MNSHFASPERSSKDDILNEYALIRDQPHIKIVLDSLPHITILVNKNRQIIYSNAGLKELKGISNTEDLLGLRPGEAIGCIHAGEEEAGCGTTRFCKYCGVVNTILRCQKSGLTETGDIQLTFDDGLRVKAIDLSISASPLKIIDFSFTLITMIDISGQKRWQMLEKIFFHDIMNKMGSLHGLIEIINNNGLASLPESIPPLMMTLGDEIIDEIKAQHNILLAENNELSIQLQQVSVPDMIDRCIKQMLRHLVAANKHIDFRNDYGEFIVETDPVLLKRIIINLIKNALEAIHENEHITIFCKKHNDTIEIAVANPGVIPMDVQMRLFVRSFSTKGANRGLGTYSVKMLTEEYLKGNVVFESNEKIGTIFRIYIKTAYPKQTVINKAGK